MLAPQPSDRILSYFAAVNVGSFRISAMITGITESGALQVAGSGHRASQGIRRGYVTDMAAATYAIRDAVERAEKAAGISVESIFVGCSGAGLSSHVSKVEIEIGGRRIEEEDIEHLLASARAMIRPDGRQVLHAQPAHYTLDGAHGVANPKGLHAERLGVDIHVMLAEGAALRNLTEAVQNAHFDVKAVVASPLASGHACLSVEERELGTVLVEIGGDVTHVAYYSGGMLTDLKVINFGSNDITDAIASTLGIRRFQAERLKCVSGSAIASPSDHRELIAVNGPAEEQPGPIARGADDKNRIARAELVSIVTQKLSELTDAAGRALKEMGFTGVNGGQIVLTGGGAELHGLADFAQGAWGMPVRIGSTQELTGLPEAHAMPGFATLAGLCIYANEDPIDIRTFGAPSANPSQYSWTQSLTRLLKALREYF